MGNIGLCQTQEDGALSPGENILAALWWMSSRGQDWRKGETAATMVMLGPKMEKSGEIQGLLSRSVPQDRMTDLIWKARED